MRGGSVKALLRAWEERWAHAVRKARAISRASGYDGAPGRPVLRITILSSRFAMLARSGPASLIGCLVPVLVFAADDAEALLKAKGLKKVATAYVLETEADLSRAFTAVQRLQ